MVLERESPGMAPKRFDANDVGDVVSTSLCATRSRGGRDAKKSIPSVVLLVAATLLA